MSNSEDIKKQLKIKNKEIYQNKLNLDLDNNLEVLVLTIDNYLQKVQNDSTEKILEIEESFFNQEKIQESISIFLNLYRENLMMLIDLKKENLQNILIIQDNLENCRDNLLSNYNNIKTNLYEFSSKNIKTLKEGLNEQMDSSFKKKRLEDYLENIFLSNLNNKVLDIIKTRDIILLNTFEETYLKYLELNKNTVGVN